MWDTNKENSHDNNCPAITVVYNASLKSVKMYPIRLFFGLCTSVSWHTAKKYFDLRGPVKSWA